MIDRIQAMARALALLGVPLCGAVVAEPFQDPGTSDRGQPPAETAGEASDPDVSEPVPSDPAAGDPASGTAQVPPVAIPTAAVGVAALVEQLAAGAPLAALELAHGYEAALDGLGPGDSARWSSPDRALLDYVAGLAAGRAVEAGSAVEEPDLERITGLVNDAADRFERAVAGAGPKRSDLRLRAAYGLGTLLAEAGERRIQRAQSMAMLTPQPVPYGPDTPERAVLDEAFATFERARDGLLERLELDWRDADTRANIEWVQRRLAEIEAVRDRADEEQKRRDEEQQEEEDQQDDDQDDGEQPQDDGSDDSGDESEDADEQDGDEQDGDEQDGDQEQGDQEGDQQDGDAADQDSESDTGADPSDDGSDPSDGAADEAADEADESSDAAQELEESDDGTEDAGEPIDVAGTPIEMTDVEVRRLLQRLAEIEAQGEATRRRLAATQRRRVARDW